MNELFSHILRHNFDYAVLAFIVASTAGIVKLIFFTPPTGSERRRK